MSASVNNGFWDWPEWQALIKRLGVTQNYIVRDFLLWVPIEGPVEIVMSYLPVTDPPTQTAPPPQP